MIAATDLLAVRLQANEQTLLASNVKHLVVALGLPASVRVQFAHLAARPES